MIPNNLKEVAWQDLNTTEGRGKSSGMSDKKDSVYMNCSCKVEMSAFCKVGMSKLPFRHMAEAEIGTSDYEWKQTAAHRGPCRGFVREAH